MHIQIMWVDSTKGEKDEYPEANCDGNCNKETKMGKNTGVKCNLYEARSPDQQMFDAKAVFELQENLIEKNPKIPLVTGLHSSISSDEWCLL